MLYIQNLVVCVVVYVIVYPATCKCVPDILVQRTYHLYLVDATSRAYGDPLPQIQDSVQWIWWCRISDSKTAFSMVTKPLATRPRGCICLDSPKKKKRKEYIEWESEG